MGITLVVGITRTTDWNKPGTNFKDNIGYS